LVRAKVMALLAGEPRQTAEGQRDLQLRRHVGYLDVAEQALRQRSACCVMMSGLPGSGKSWLAAQLAPELEAIQVRSDLERKRMAGLAPLQPSHSHVGAGIYSEAQTAVVYQRLEQCVAEILSGHRIAIVDANFGLRSQRDAVAQLCSLLEVPLMVVHCEAPMPLLRQRIQSRLGSGSDPSEADVAVLEAQLAQRAPISADELLTVIAADTSRADVVAHVLGELRRHLGDQSSHEGRSRPVAGS
jgi:predicted kinase